MLALSYIKSVPRYLLVRTLAPKLPQISTSSLSSLKLGNVTPPTLPGKEWIRINTRLSGICGSDISTIKAKGSFYLSPFVSFPFVLGHEVVGTVSEVGSSVSKIAVGERVVIEPNLSCQVRGISSLCPQCQKGNYGNCENVTLGDIAPGLQTGYCQTTGGGWSSELVAHQLQVHVVPDKLSDEEAVLIEPFSCAIHGVLKANLQGDETVMVMGCGVIGLLTIAAMRALGYKCRVLAIAKYPHQEELAQVLGANQVFRYSKNIHQEISTFLKSKIFQPDLGKPVLASGVDCTFDCVATSNSIDDSLRLTRANGKVVLVGMPAVPKGIDWTAMWYKELQIIGAYTYGTEIYQGEKIRTFTLALRLMEQQDGLLKSLITGYYKLQDYRQAMKTAMNSKQSKSIKTVFDLR
ncbi:alcohol dehydrogenase [Dulcicalothrix desertica PCC 7102]|uniref:Alcohol dehydrogenase n=1 Tax=Dulcicalothrix desertica PCC 7102 TaxID=232991 RepID=A0A433VME5_9CYAN|nr:zinc-binding dehydrogenase [Dulcicalothrix desertica]RUT07251.1 alcohol dehydrogenase [Dulcicalothrix desertica PCC 7102]TWH61755.1 threonine dehydrogenase-like Zn-dependent dehydrogenase [Dulcicalothrix desertica PCC 7102]